MLNEKTEKIIVDKANRVLDQMIKRGENAEIVYLPVVFERNSEGKVGCITTFDDYIIQLEN